jgi:hypothetical protein
LVLKEREKLSNCLNKRKFFIGGINSFLFHNTIGRVSGIIPKGEVNGKSHDINLL